MASWPMVEPPKAGPRPTPARLHEAALAHLARYATTRQGLVRVLDRRVDRWLRRAGETDALAKVELRRWVREVAGRLVASGVIDDAAFAEARARTLTRAGRSRRAVAAHLGARGVDQGIVAEATQDDPETELAACLALTRRRRIGPFRRPEAEPDLAREMAMIARAGFSHETARRAMAMEAEEALALVIALKQI